MKILIPINLRFTIDQSVNSSSCVVVREIAMDVLSIVTRLPVAVGQ